MVSAYLPPMMHRASSCKSNGDPPYLLYHRLFSNPLLSVNIRKITLFASIWVYPSFLTQDTTIVFFVRLSLKFSNSWSVVQCFCPKRGSCSLPPIFDRRDHEWIGFIRAICTPSFPSCRSETISNIFSLLAIYFLFLRDTFSFIPFQEEIKTSRDWSDGYGFAIWRNVRSSLLYLPTGFSSPPSPILLPFSPSLSFFMLLHVVSHTYFLYLLILRKKTKRVRSEKKSLVPSLLDSLEPFTFLLTEKPR